MAGSATIFMFGKWVLGSATGTRSGVRRVAESWAQWRLTAHLNSGETGWRNGEDDRMSMNLNLPGGGDIREEFERSQYIVVRDALPADLIEECRARAQELTTFARSIRRTDGEFRLVYRVVTGDVIQERWPELFALYQDHVFPDWIRQVTGEEAIVHSSELQSAVNLNIMRSDSIYRWHFDAVAYTLLLYVSDVLPEDGGALEVVPACKAHDVPDLATAQRIELWPTAGTLVLMDGTRCYHHVAPLRRPITRFSIPMVYPTAATAEQRPAGLNSYLYGSGP